MLSETRAADPCTELTQSRERCWCPSQDQWAALHVASLSAFWLPPAPNYKTNFQGRGTGLPPLITLLLSSREELCQASGAGWCLGWTVPKSRLYVCTWVLWIFILFSLGLLPSFFFFATSDSSFMSCVESKFTRLWPSSMLYLHSTCDGGPHPRKRWEEKGTLCFHFMEAQSFPFYSAGCWGIR